MKYLLFLPELILILGSLTVFILALGSGRDLLAARVTAIAALAAAAASAATLGLQGDLFFLAYRVDLFSQLFKLFIAGGLAAVALFGRELPDIRDDVRPEYFLLLLLGSLGLLMLVSSVELISLVVALELSSCALYLLVPLRREGPGLRIQMESAAKYAMFGVAATGVLLFGMSYLFGMTGSTYFVDLAPALATRWSDPAAVAAISLTLLGLFFKLAAFPMHLWAPDVYQGAANETTAFVAAVPKVAAVAVLIRFLLCADPSDARLTLLLTISSIGSMFLGNLVALVQKDLKRMLGYSTIAHAGYVMLGFAAMGQGGYGAAIFYIIGFMAMNLTAFLVICRVSPEGRNPLVNDLAGLHSRAPLAALMLAGSMFALAGIPPFVGFIGKFQLMAAALDRGLVALVIIAAVNTAIGVYYYLNVVRVIYFEPAGDLPGVRLARLDAVLGVALFLIIIIMGILPAPLLDAAVASVRGMGF